MNEKYFVSWSNYDGAYNIELLTWSEVVAFLVDLRRANRVGVNGFTEPIIVRGVRLNAQTGEPL